MSGCKVQHSLVKWAKMWYNRSRKENGPGGALQ